MTRGPAGKNIVLIGYRGTGKSTVGRLLAARIGYGFVSTDELIKECAAQSITDFVAAHGWEAFRDLESRVVEECAKGSGAVIDTGGGVVLRPENVTALRAHGLVVWLTADPAAIAERIQDGDDRPALTEGRTFLEEIAEIVNARKPLYECAADCTVATDGQPPEAIASLILERLRASGWFPPGGTA